MEQNFKSGFVTLIGRPNVGKSTLMNHLIGQKIAITSDKPQTTRNRIQTVYTDERGQIIFLDTPGIHKAKNKLGEYMVSVAEHTLQEVDVILWLVEPTTFIGAGERHIAEQLKKVKTPVLLVINKIDTVKNKEDILTFIAAYKDICSFSEIIPVSALKEINVEDVKDSIFKYLPYGPQFYDEDTVTDQPMRQIAAELIREKVGYDLLSKGNIDTILAALPKVGQLLMGSISSFAINVVVLLFVLYFMLIGGRDMEEYVSEILPFNKRNKKNILHEFNMIVKSNAIGIPLLAVIQGAVAMLGYFIFGAPSPVLWGFLSCFATIIPIVGTALIWVPLALYMGMTGHWGMAIGLAAYALVVISNVDNLVRFMLQKKMADTHPLITIFGVVIGLSLFGFMGVIFGPLLLSIFVFCVNIFKVEYLEGEGRTRPKIYKP